MLVIHDKLQFKGLETSVLIKFLSVTIDNYFFYRLFAVSIELIVNFIVLIIKKYNYYQNNIYFEINKVYFTR